MRKSETCVKIIAMKALIQRVKSARVLVGDNVVSEIGKGLIVYLCVVKGDREIATESVMADKLAKMRIFSDENGKLNYSVKDVGGEILLVPQFTLCADTSQNRPSFFDAADKILARKALAFTEYELMHKHHVSVKHGAFGEDMIVEQVGDGPVTIIYDTEIKKSAEKKNNDD